MPRRGRLDSLRLTVGEIQLLKSLWTIGPATIAEVHAQFDPAIGYTTVQTRLNRLVAKGIASKSSRRPAKYSAAVSAEDVNRADLGTLVRRVNDGSVVPLVAHLLQEREVSEAEFLELKALIEETERRLRNQEE